MAKINQNVILWRDRFRVVQFTIEEVEDLEGYTAEWAMSASAGSSALVSKSTSDDVEIDDVKVFVTFYPSDFTSTSADEYYHELLLYDGEGNPIQAVTGNVDLRSVTIASV